MKETSPNHLGGGITGVFSAYVLAEAGADVTLVEPAGIANAASGANPGGLNPLHGTGIPGPLQACALECFGLHQAAWSTFRSTSRVEFRGDPSSRIHLAFEDDDLPRLEQTFERHQGAPGFSARWVERDTLLAVEPRLAPDVIRAVWTDGNAFVDAGAYTSAIAGRASLQPTGGTHTVASAATVFHAAKSTPVLSAASRSWPARTRRPAAGGARTSSERASGTTSGGHGIK